MSCPAKFSSCTSSDSYAVPFSRALSGQTEQKSVLRWIMQLHVAVCEPFIDVVNNPVHRISRMKAA